MTAEDWSAVTSDGLRRRQGQAVAQLTVRQRMEWLSDAVELAAASGALE